MRCNLVVDYCQHRSVQKLSHYRSLFNSTFTSTSNKIPLLILSSNKGYLPTAAQAYSTAAQASSNAAQVLRSVPVSATGQVALLLYNIVVSRYCLPLSLHKCFILYKYLCCLLLPKYHRRHCRPSLLSSVIVVSLCIVPPDKYYCT